MKLFGAVCIFVFFSLLGIFKGEKEKEQLAECEAFAEIFVYIKNQVDYFLTPTKKIYSNISNEMLEKKGFLPSLRSHENDEVYSNVWRLSFESVRNAFHLSEKQETIIFGFGDSIGKASDKIQTNSFDYYIAELNGEISKQKKETAKNVKLYRTLGMTAGALAAILII